MTTWLRATLIALAAATPGCAPAADPPATTPDAADPGSSPTATYLTPTEHLTRASLVLRGIRPTVADLTEVAADPDQLPALVDSYLASPQFATTIKELHNETLLMRVEQRGFTYPALAPLPATITAAQVNGSMYDEPLELIADIVTHDQPYTDIVTASYTMADGVVAAIWGLPHTAAPATWQRTPYTDGRGAAGILATSSFYQRWRSVGTNFNRGRANVISRALLCHDYLTADIHLDTSIDLADPEAVATAVQTNGSCAGCHQTLDPLASYLFAWTGSTLPSRIPSYPTSPYDGTKATRWMTTNHRAPGYFGSQPVGLAGFGAAIAADPRFAQCTATHFAAYLSEVPEAALPRAWVARLQAQFVASGFNAKQLAKAVVLSDEFRVATDTDPGRAETTVGYQKLRPEQLSRSLTELTGFRWMYDERVRRLGLLPYGRTDLLTGDFVGFRVLAGGIDSYFVTEPVHTLNATSSLVARTAAAAAAETVVVADAAAAAADRTLFVEAAPGASDEAHVRAELVYLHARIYGEIVEPASPAVDESYELFTAALGGSHTPAAAQHAWQVTLTAMLSDHRFLYF